MRRIRSVRALAGQLADVALSVRETLLDSVERRSDLLPKLRQFWVGHLQLQLEGPDLAAATAQVMVLGRVVSEVLRQSRCVEPSQIRSIVAASELEPLVPDPDEQTLREIFAHFESAQLLPKLSATVGWELFAELSEQFLAQYDRETRKKRGVYYTPASVARFILLSVDDLLRRKLQLAGGLAERTGWYRGDLLPRANNGQAVIAPPLQILDPATGSGVFLLAAIDIIHSNCVATWSQDGSSPAEIAHRWKHYADEWMLPMLRGYELLPAVAMMANDLIAAKLAFTGYIYRSRRPSVVRVHNPLDGPPIDGLPRGERFIVVIGNPPFSGISNNNGVWVSDLLRGKLPGGERVASYYEVNGEPLVERKVWLQDDYVKFFRYAQWLIEDHAGGVLGFVTNHGYLENASFRGMRQSLIEAFSDIDIVDLHGSRKKHEMCEDGRPDENVFDIEQGIAISVCARLPHTTSISRVNHGDLWGDRTAKLSALSRADSRQLATEQFTPQAPDYFFYPRMQSSREEYNRSLLLTEVMPFYSSAVVTARDSFVVACDRQELVERIRQFRDLSIPDEHIRARYFTNGRSAKYLPGDTRGWKLPAARRQVAADVDWENRLLPCAYRPWDTRWIYWADWMIDWPRPELARHVIGVPNQMLVARRQMPRHQPCNYFWTCDAVAIDGVIRSDNRGNETLFPLYIYDETGTVSRGSRQANFAVCFIERMCSVVRLKWIPDGAGDLYRTIGPEDLFNYIYAGFHSADYRSRYAERLHVDFPRIVVHPERQLVVELCRLGKRLTQLHHLTADVENVERARWQGISGPVQVEKGFPRFEQQRVYWRPSQWVEPVPENVWRYRVGVHQVCRKWLKDRRGHYLTCNELERYLDIVSAIGHTIETVAELDCVVDKFGGWKVT